MKKTILSLVLLTLTCVMASAQQTIIHCGTLIDGKSNTAQKEMSIIIEGEQIISVVKGHAKAGSGDQVIDLKSQTVMPGLMDMHVHLESETGPQKYLERFVLNDADVAFNSIVYAERTLMSGFTTVRDLGGTGVNISLRDAIAAGKVNTPKSHHGR